MYATIIIGVIAAFILGILVGQLIESRNDDPIGTIVVDPIAKEFELQLDDEKALDGLLHSKDIAVFEVERNTDTTNEILSE